MSEEDPWITAARDKIVALSTDKKNELLLRIVVLFGNDPDEPIDGGDFLQDVNELLGFLREEV